MTTLTRRQILASAAATAAVAAMPAAAIAAVEEAPIGLLTIDIWAEANLDPSFRGFVASPFALDEANRPAGYSIRRKEPV